MAVVRARIPAPPLAKPPGVAMPASIIVAAIVRSVACGPRLIVKLCTILPRLNVPLIKAGPVASETAVTPPLNTAVPRPEESFPPVMAKPPLRVSVFELPVLVNV